MGSRDGDPEDYQKAIDLYLVLLAHNPDDDRVRLALKAMSLRQSQAKGAVAKLLLAPLRKALHSELRKAGKDCVTRMALYQRYLLEDPCNSEARTTLARTLLEQGHIVGAAIEAEMAIRDDPSNRKAMDVQLKCFTRLGRNDEADAIRGRIKSLWKGPDRRPK